MVLKKSQLAFVFGFLLLWLIIEARADNNVWTSTGPFGGNIRALAVAPSNPQIIYAGTGSRVGSGPGGVFVSMDGAATWSATSFLNSEVFGLGVDPHDPNIVYVAALHGLFKTTDGGGKWTNVTTDAIPLVSMRAVAIDPADSTTIYAGSDVGVFKSTNAGNSWNAANSGLASLKISTLAFNSANPAVLYAGATGGGLHKSLDRGNIWIEINEGMGRIDVTSIAINPVDSNTIFLTRFGGAFKTTNGGANWQSLPISGDLRSVAIDPSNPNTVYIGDTLRNTSNGLYRSTNGGMSWSPQTDTPTDRIVWSFGVGPLGSSAVYLGGDIGGVFKTTDQGTTWNGVNNGLSNTDVRALALNPSNSSALYAGTRDNGVFKSTDRGQHWTAKPGSSPVTECLVIDPSNPNVVYSAPNALKSTDGGDTWKIITSGLLDPLRPTSLRVFSIAIDSSNPRTLYAASFLGVFRSNNGGKEWKWSSLGIFSQPVVSVTVDPSNPSIVYAGTAALYKSTDAGANWTRTGLSAGASITSIAIDASQPDVVYVGGGGAYTSTDAGGHWTRFLIQNGGVGFSVFAIAVAPSSPNIVYVGTSAGGVFRSGDRGATWSQINDGLTNLNVRSLAVDPLDPNVVYAGTAGGGVFSIHIQVKPRIAGVSTSGKHLIVTGGDFLGGAKIVMNGDDRKTLRDDQNPNALIGKKLVKKIGRGDTVTLQVRNPDGLLSDPVQFTRP